MVWEKREGVWETETEEMEEDDRHWKKRNTASERKQTGKKGGRKCRKRRERERNVILSPCSARKGRGGNKSPDRVLPAPLLVLAGKLWRRGGVLFEHPLPLNK